MSRHDWNDDADWIVFEFIRLERCPCDDCRALCESQTRAARQIVALRDSLAGEIAKLPHGPGAQSMISHLGLARIVVGMGLFTEVAP